MADLPTNFKDDILDTSVNTRRRYRMYENTDGTIELEDVTEYSQVGNEFGAGQINETNTEVNKKFDKNMLVRDLDTINAITKEGYAPDALALKEVNESLSGLKTIKLIPFTTGSIPAQTWIKQTIDISSLGFTEPPSLIGFTASWVVLQVDPDTPATKDSITISITNPRSTEFSLTQGYLSLYGK